MKSYYLQYKTKISLKRATDKIAMHAMLGEHIHSAERPATKADVCNLLLSWGEDPNKLAEKCRDWRKNVPHFENLLGSTWHFPGSGKVEIVDTKTDESIGQITDPGTVSLSTYQTHFETACKARDRAVENSSYPDLQTSLVHGVASIESYITKLARAWNQQNPSDQLIDSKQNKFSLDDKFDIWIPKITKGKKLDKSDRCWNDFVTLRRIRDRVAVHPKLGAQIVAYTNLAKYINSFRWGIAGLLGTLHRLTGEWIPSAVINAFYMPDVEVIEENQKST